MAQRPQEGDPCTRDRCKEVAQELGISPKTVGHHVSPVLRKLQLTNRHQLSRWATERRLVV
jgi:DNA-binding CsgD family transcriptional regulator